MCECVWVFTETCASCCLKCVACRLRRLTQNHSAVHALSLTKSSAKQEGKISHLRCQDSVRNILSFACLFDECLRLRADTRRRWLDSQTAVEPERVSRILRSSVLLFLIKLIRGVAVGAGLTAAGDRRSTYCCPQAVAVQELHEKCGSTGCQEWLKALWVLRAVGLRAFTLVVFVCVFFFFNLYIFHFIFCFLWALPRAAAPD